MWNWNYCFVSYCKKGCVIVPTLCETHSIIFEDSQELFLVMLIVQLMDLKEMSVFPFVTANPTEVLPRHTPPPLNFENVDLYAIVSQLGTKSLLG